MWQHELLLDITVTESNTKHETIDKISRTIVQFNNISNCCTKRLLSTKFSISSGPLKAISTAGLMTIDW